MPLEEGGLRGRTHVPHSRVNSDVALVGNDSISCARSPLPSSDLTSAEPYYNLRYNMVLCRVNISFTHLMGARRNTQSELDGDAQRKGVDGHESSHPSKGGLVKC